MCDGWDDSGHIEKPQIIKFNMISDEEEAHYNKLWEAIGTSVSSDDNHKCNKTSNFTNRNRGVGGRGSNDRGYRGNGRSWRSQQDRSKDVSSVLEIPTRYVGRVIGRGGSKIQELQEETLAKIIVTKDTIGDKTKIKIFGTSASVTKAKNLIVDLTTDTIKFVYPEDTPVETPPEKPRILNWSEILKASDARVAEEWKKYPQIKKDFYKPHSDILAMSEQDVEIFRKENNKIVVSRTFKSEKSNSIPKPCPKFINAFHQYPDILDVIGKAGFQKPSPIQAQAWPVLLSGEDLIGIAQTGTGKTLAFLLPALIHIDGQPGNRVDRGGPAVLIMAPTRELALQIHKEIKKYQYKGITSVCLYGGGNRKEQVDTVTAGVDIVIATPGRLNDLVSADHLDVRTVTYAVLDEADRMLDMGFEPQIRKVMYCIRPNRQTVMTSATWPQGVRRLAQSYMVDPVQIYVGSLDLAATHTVTQIIKIMADDEDVKMATFMDFVRNLEPLHKVIAFCSRKARATHVTTELALVGLRCQSLHGDREQSDREQALLDIQSGRVQILIATDLASRGLDIDDVTHVVNYDFPTSIEEYVHRVGRTGRAGKYGESISYFTSADWAHARELIKILDEANQHVPDGLYGMADRFEAAKQKKEKNRERSSGRGGARPRFGAHGERYW